MSKKTQPLEELRLFDFVEKINPDSRKLLGQRLHISKFAQGQEIMQKEARVSGAFLITRGRLRIFTISKAGQEGTLYTLKPGDTCVFICLTCLFNDMLYPAWVESATNSRVAVIPASVFKKLFAREPAVHRLLFDALASLVFDLTVNIDSIMASNLETRLASFLLTRASSSGELNISHEQIAGQLGNAREVISRQLKSFREKNGWKPREG